MKIKPKMMALVAVILLCFSALIVTAIFHSSQKPEPLPVKWFGYYQSSEGIEDASTRSMVLPGSYKEAVVNNGYLLTSSKEGTLTLTRISDKQVIKIDENKHAYQLKSFRDGFGYIQQRGEEQHITFLNPETGTSNVLKTNHSVITWDALGKDIAYHLYDTTKLGFAKYEGKQTAKILSEIDGNIDTVGQVFSENGKNYLWVVANHSDNVIYSMDTHQNVSSDFPVIQKVIDNNATIAEIVGSCWIVTDAAENSQNAFSQVWDKDGKELSNMGMNGYLFSGNATEGDGLVYIPVSYTAGSTPDGLLVMNPQTGSTYFEDKLQAYIPV